MIGRLINLAEGFVKDSLPIELKVDSIGIGVGVISRLKEVVSEKGFENVRVVGCNSGESPQTDKEKEDFANAKALNHFRIKDLFHEGSLKIPNIGKLTNQLLSLKFELTSTGKVRIVDPDKSPDWASALAFFVWKGKPPLCWTFI